MHLNPHLTFDGQCQDAFRFYAETFGGEVTLMMTFGDSPLAAEFSVETANRVLHATVVFKGLTLTGGDEPPDRYRKPQGVSLLLDVDDDAEAEQIFAALAEGGTVQMPLAQTFWAKRFGMLTDRFGIPWMVNCGG